MSTVKRLFRQFEPANYVLELTIDPDNMRFWGQVSITGKKVGRPSRRFTFHQNGLKVTNASIQHHDKKSDRISEVNRINLHKSFDEVRLHAAQLIYPGEYKICLQFSGHITNTMEGIYACHFKHDGQAKKLIATQFESHHARQAFPCIDEPEAKATFELTFTTPSGLTVLSNMPIREATRVSAQTKTSFEISPRMSPYLVAFVCGEMHCIEGKSSRGITVRSWSSVAQQRSHLEYANREAIRCLDFFEDYFRTPFPLSKIDQVALPDFDALAMENWGLVTFRELAMLTDPHNHSISGERFVTMVVAHEMAHQWFGDLVTMRWWDDLWLNESFASVMESLAPDKLHPDWHEWEDFTATRVLAAADRDVYREVQPIGVPVNHPDEILTLFDPSILYAKGARILKTLRDLIGDDAFRRGLAIYFNKYAFQNTTRDDLWQEFSAASQIDVGTLMTSWIKQSGTPELKVTRQGETMRLSQERFLLDGHDPDTLWPIPLLADQVVEPRVMTTRTVTVKPSNQKMPMFNPDGIGHFITNYQDPADRQMLYEKIAERTLPATGRIISLNDMLMLARKGEGSLVDVLKLVTRCPHEDRNAVWVMFVRAIQQTQLLVDGNEGLEDKLKLYRYDLAAYWYEQLGWDQSPKEDANTKQLRTTVLGLIVESESQPAVDIAFAKFQASTNVEALPAEQRAIIASAAVRSGQPAVIDKLLREYELAANPDVRASITVALGSTQNPEVAERVIAWGFFDDKIVKPQDIDRFFMRFMRNYHTRDVAWRWLEQHWPHLIKQFGEGKHMEYFIWHASQPLSTPEWWQRYREFFDAKKQEVSLKRNILISFAEIEARVAWRRREEPLLERYFQTTNR